VTKARRIIGDERAFVVIGFRRGKELEAQPTSMKPFDEKIDTHVFEEVNGEKREVIIYCSCGERRIPITFSHSVAFVCPKSHFWNFWKHTYRKAALWNLFLPQYPIVKSVHNGNAPSTASGFQENANSS
jgi:hypothetical protein